MTRRATGFTQGSGVLSRLLSPGRACVVSFVHETHPDTVVQTQDLTQLNQEAQKAAACLLERGIARGERVVLCLPTGPDFCPWFLGALWMGAVPVPLPAFNQLRSKPSLVQRVKGVIADCTPRALVADPVTLSLLKEYEPRLLLLNADARAQTKSLPPAVEDTDEDIAFLQYTAGSTGNPKGVVVTRGNLRANLQAIGEAVEVTPKDRVVSWLPLYHDMGLIGALLFCLYWKLPLFLYSPLGFVHKPSGWLHAISKYRATLAPGPHFAFALCARKLPERELEGLDLSSWRLALDGSEPVRPSSMRLFIERFAKYGFCASAYHPVYGMSEATLAISMPTASEGPHVDRIQRETLQQRGVAVPSLGELGAAEFVSVGKAVPGHRVEIRELNSGALCPERQVGQVCFIGPSVTPRYFRSEEDGVPPREILETGDLGYVAEGRLYVVDRAKDLIIHAGANYYPTDLERTVESVPGIKRGRVVAFGAPSHDTATEGVVIAAEVVSRKDAPRIADEVRHQIASTHGLTLEALVLLPLKTLPVTLNGKLMRGRARGEYLQGTLGPQLPVRHAE